MRTSEQRHEGYKKLRVAGKCIQCCKAARPGKSYCTDCQAKHNLRSKARRADRMKEGLCPSCGGTPVPGMKLCSVCIERGRAKNRRLRDEVINAYGGYRCQCPGCAETEHEFMTIDHVNGGGTKHRREIGRNTYNWLKQHKYPSGYRVLCFNCNSSRGLYGYCPHERRSNGDSKSA